MRDFMGVGQTRQWVVLLLILILGCLGLVFSTMPQEHVGAQSSDLQFSPRIRVIIQKMDETDDVENLITQLGGEVQTSLPIIGGFSAEIPAAIFHTLQSDPTIKNISLDIAVNDEPQIALPVSEEPTANRYSIYMPLLFGSSEAPAPTTPPTDENELFIHQPNAHVIYDEQLQNGWQDVSWQPIATPTTNLTHSGDRALAIENAWGWSGFALHTAQSLDAQQFNELGFWIHGGDAGSQQIWLMVIDSKGQGSQASNVLVSPKANQWQYYRIPLNELGSPEDISAIVWQSFSSDPQATLYLDDIGLFYEDRPNYDTHRAAKGTISLEYWTGINEWGLSTLLKLDDFPHNPAGTATLTKFANWNSYGNDFGTRIHGYIYPPVTGQYQFWVAGDDQAELFLSTTANPENKRRIASAPGWTNGNEWTKYPEQQSALITLQAGQRYYIEALQYDRTQGDHVSVAWQIPGQSQAVIDGAYLSPAESNLGNTMVSRMGLVEQARWTNIGYVDAVADLYNHPNYPDNPTSTNWEVNLHSSYESTVEMGARVRGFLHPPVTGTYRFWLASDEYGEFYLSPTGNPADKQLIASVPGWTQWMEWDKYPEQKSAEITLQAGQRYYFETNHINQTGGSSLQVGWEIPGESLELVEGWYLSPYDTANQYVDGGCSTSLSREAEDGMLSGDMVVGSADGTTYINANNGWGNPNSIHYAIYCVDITIPGTYQLDGRVRGLGDDHDSFWVTVDGGETFLWDIPQSSNFVNDWLSNRDGADPVQLNLTAGQHLFTFFKREAGSQLDNFTLALVETDANAGRPQTRVKTGLQHLYTFEEGIGDRINDVSGVGTPLNLRIHSYNNTHWTNGGLSVDSSTLIDSELSGSATTTACQQSNELTFEAWIIPSATSNVNDGRIVSLSKDTTLRNATLQQTDGVYKGRVRTSSTNDNGSTLVTGNSVAANELQHVVFTWSQSSGKSKIYINGQLDTQKSVSGTLANWNSSYRLALANEHTWDRGWLGEYQLVAIYCRDLTDSEIQQNYNVGPDGDIDTTKKILYVGATTPLYSRDQKIVNQLTEWGYMVSVVHDEVNVEDATQFDLIIISETVNSGHVSGTFRNVQVPVLTWESHIMDEMTMTKSGENGELYDATKITIVDADHRLAAGYTGTRTTNVATNEEHNWGKPTSDADIIAVHNYDANKPVIFIYEAGDAMVGNFEAPATRIGFFYGDGDGLNDTGWDLLRVAVECAYETGYAPYESADHLNHLNLDPVYEQGIDGSGVTIAIVDSGIHGPNVGKQPLASYSAINGSAHIDEHGHGTFMASAAASRKPTPDNKTVGVAPGADIVDVRVLDKQGRGTYSELLDGLNWVLENRDTYNIRVVNLSVMGPVTGAYWDNPINLAVEALWDAGIVVVAAAGNTGPHAGSITTPGNDPFIITVGAFTDAYSVYDPSDDYIPEFSAAGPTEAGFVKPDVIAPGAHIVMPQQTGSAWSTEHPELHMGKGYYKGAGTSAATAITSGVIALMLDANDELTPNQVKHRLMVSAEPLIRNDGSNQLTYSILQQGAGKIQAAAAIFDSIGGEANAGMQVGSEYVGPVIYDEERGGYLFVDENRNPLPDGAAYFWDGTYYWGGTYYWAGTYYWNGTYYWTGSYYWAGTYYWNGSYFDHSTYYWNGSYYWAGTYYWGGNDYWLGFIDSAD